MGEGPQKYYCMYAGICSPGIDFNILRALLMCWEKSRNVEKCQEKSKNVEIKKPCRKCRPPLWGGGGPYIFWQFFCVPWNPTFEITCKILIRKVQKIVKIHHASLIGLVFHKLIFFLQLLVETFVRINFCEGHFFDWHLLDEFTQYQISHSL